MVSVGSVKGIPDPLLDTEDNAAHCPLSSYSYYITYDVFSHQASAATVTCPSETRRCHFTGNVSLEKGGKRKKWLKPDDLFCP